jgi:hypothetical protein
MRAQVPQIAFMSQAPGFLVFRYLWECALERLLDRMEAQDDPGGAPSR